MGKLPYTGIQKHGPEKLQLKIFKIFLDNSIVYDLISSSVTSRSRVRHKKKWSETTALFLLVILSAEETTSGAHQAKTTTTRRLFYK